MRDGDVLLVVFERDELRRQLDAIQAALFEGGQSDEARCRKAKRLIGKYIASRISDDGGSR
jgi:hypothetical protein